MVRRFGPAALAIAIAVAVCIGLTWYVLVDSIGESYDGKAGGECGVSAPAEIITNLTSYAPVPDVPALAPARRAFLRTMGAERWQIEISSKEANAPDPARMTAVRDGDAIEFRREDGTRVG